MSREVDRLDQRLTNLFNQLLDKVNDMSKIMEDLRAAVDAERTVSGGIVVLLDEMAKKLSDALASGDVAGMQAIVTDLRGNSATLQEAILRNTAAAPVEPAPTPTGEAPVVSDPALPVADQGNVPDPAPVNPVDQAPADAPVDSQPQ